MTHLGWIPGTTYVSPNLQRMSSENSEVWSPKEQNRIEQNKKQLPFSGIEEETEQ